MDSIAAVGLQDQKFATRGCTDRTCVKVRGNATCGVGSRSCEGEPADQAVAGRRADWMRQLRLHQYRVFPHAPLRRRDRRVHGQRHPPRGVAQPGILGSLLHGQRGRAAGKRHDSDRVRRLESRIPRGLRGSGVEQGKDVTSRSLMSSVGTVDRLIDVMDRCPGRVDLGSTGRTAGLAREFER